jgi:hypothetical protein
VHFIDLKWKGIRIRSWFRHLLRRVFLALFLFPVLGIFLFQLVQFVKANYNGLIIEFLDKFSVSLFLGFLAKSLILGVPFSLLFFLLGIKLWDYLANLQRLCRLVYHSKFYQVNDIESPNMMVDKRAKVSRELSYFPDIYYHINKKWIDITFRLDGSKEHLSGLFKQLSEPLEEMLCLSLIDIEERNGFYTYRFLRDNSVMRISIDDMTPENYEIPLMKHISWNVLKTPNALISGVIGGGKTYLLLALIRSFILLGAEIRIGDPKNADLADLACLFDDVYVKDEDILKMLERTVQEMDDRYDEMKLKPEYKTGGWFYEYGYAPVVVIIDEYVSLVDGMKKADLDRFKRCVKQIVLKGRQAGFWVIPATQRPDAKYLDGDIRDQLGLRIGLGRMSQDGYRMVFGSTDQKLRAKKGIGRGYLEIAGDSFISECLTPFVPEKYPFIQEYARLLGVEPRAFLRSRKKANEDFSPSGETLQKQSVTYVKEEHE